MKMQKKKILSELYNGNIVPQSRPIPKDSKYREIQMKLSDLEDAINQKLTTEDKKLFDELLSACSDLSTANGEECFTTGFRLGARMVLEIFEKDDELLDLKEV
jgi:hypothetical protein